MADIQGKQQIEQWTGLKVGETLFDTDVHDHRQGSSLLNKNILEKKQLLFYIDSFDGEIFGYYSNTPIGPRLNCQNATDSKSFLFNVQSQGNRLPGPMKFEVKNLKEGGHYLYPDSEEMLIQIGEIQLYKQHKRSQTCCVQHDDIFDYHGIENALNGAYPNVFDCMMFIPMRIRVIQMK